MNSTYDSNALEALCRDPHRLKLFRNAFFKKALPFKECLEKATELAGKLSFQQLENLERHDSQRDGATKLVFRTSDGHKIEAVILRIASGRTSLCISSQVGCAADCQFCATGKLGFIRNLTAAEMLDQVLLAKRLLREEGRTLRNVVVMGMGEPLRNEANLFQCLEILRDPRFFNLSDNHLLVSTVGIPDAMLRFAERFPKIRLALSLHSARQEVRERIMPVAKFQTLEKLKSVFPKLACPEGARRGEFMVE
ncbi:MAG: radical SAM protein [Kiritimatiellales bacterium]